MLLEMYYGLKLLMTLDRCKTRFVILQVFPKPSAGVKRMYEGISKNYWPGIFFFFKDVSQGVKFEQLYKLQSVCLVQTL